MLVHAIRIKIEFIKIEQLQVHFQDRTRVGGFAAYVMLCPPLITPSSGAHPTQSVPRNARGPAPHHHHQQPCDVNGQLWFACAPWRHVSSSMEIRKGGSFDFV